MNNLAAISVDESLLIAKTRRMIAAIGLPKTLVLLETLGGTPLELPNGRFLRRTGGVLAELLGQDAADAFHAEFAVNGERRILLPKADKILIQIRDRAICAEVEDVSVRSQALKYRLTVRQIQKIRQKGVPVAARGSINQLDLFEAPISAIDTRARA